MHDLPSNNRPETKSNETREHITQHTSTRGRGFPTVPPFRTPCKGLDIAITNYRELRKSARNINMQL